MHKALNPQPHFNQKPYDINKSGIFALPLPYHLPPLAPASLLARPTPTTHLILPFYALSYQT